MSIKPGQSLGHYRIIEQIGKGGMATVYRASQPSLSRQVAIKILPEFFAQDPAFHERFRQEATAIAKLRHPNILTVFDSGESDGIAYIVTELVDGGTLADKLGKRLPTSECVALIQPIASALDYAHARGMVHRDVKPSNILIAADGTPILSDFGLARITSTEGDTVARLTATGTALGTPEYMAPEQIHNKTVGPAADIYALAITLYEMLTGSPPYSGDTPIALLAKRLSDPLPLPRERNPDLSEAVQNVLLKGLAKEPADRYATAGAMIQALEATGAREHKPAVAPAAAAPSRGKLPLLLALAGGAAVLVLALTMGPFAIWSRTNSTGSTPPATAQTRPPTSTPAQTPSTAAGTGSSATASPPPPASPLPSPAASGSPVPKPAATTTVPTKSSDSLPPHGRLMFSLSTDLATMAAAPQREPENTIVVKNGALEFTAGSQAGAAAQLPLRDVGDFVAVLKYAAVSRQPWLTFRFHVSPGTGPSHAVRLPAYLQLTPPLAGSKPGEPHLCCQPFDIFLAPQRPDLMSLFLGPMPVALPAAENDEQFTTIVASGPQIVVTAGGKEIARASDATVGRGSMNFGVATGHNQTPAVLRLSMLDVYEPASAGTRGAPPATTPSRGAPTLPSHGKLLYSMDAAVLARTPQQQPENTVVAKGNALEFTVGTDMGAIAVPQFDGVGDFVALLKFVPVAGQPVILLRFHRNGPQTAHVVKIPAFARLAPPAPQAAPLGVHQCCRDFDVYLAPLTPSGSPSLFTSAMPSAIAAPPNEEQSIVVSVKGPLIVVYAQGQEIARVSDNSLGPGRLSVQWYLACADRFLLHSG